MRREYLFIPLVSIVTAVTLTAGWEVLARCIWAEDNHDACLIEDPERGNLHRPNCSTRMKNAEGDWVDYRFNECGYRSEASCLAKPAGTTRIVLMGSSISEGLFVSYPETFAARAGAELTRVSGHPVEIQNLGVPANSTDPVNAADRRLSEALALRPEIVILPINEYDLKQTADPRLHLRQNIGQSQNQGLLSAVRNSRTRLIAAHYLFGERSMLLSSYFAHDVSGSLTHVPLAPSWEEHLANLNAAVAHMASQTHRAGVRLVLMAIPTRLAAAELSAGSPPPDVDASLYRHEEPSEFGRRVAAIAARNDVGYVDVVQEFRRTPLAEECYYPVDGHLNAAGHAVVARAVVRYLRQPLLPTPRFVTRPAEKKHTEA